MAVDDTSKSSLIKVKFVSETTFGEILPLSWQNWIVQARSQKVNKKRIRIIRKAYNFDSFEE